MRRLVFALFLVGCGPAGGNPLNDCHWNPSRFAALDDCEWMQSELCMRIVDCTGITLYDCATWIKSGYDCHSASCENPGIDTCISDIQHERCSQITVYQPLPGSCWHLFE